MSSPHAPALYVGLMSGTSMDGVDAVLVDFSQGLTALAEYFVPYPSDLKQTLLALNAPGDNELHLSALAANAVSRLYAQAVNALLEKQGLTPPLITALGAHGQTVRHQPSCHDPEGYTIQLLNAALLAELTGIDVIYDFRSRDVAAKGQGAPLVPGFHDALFSRQEAYTAVLNLGGISNLSWLPPKSQRPPIPPLECDSRVVIGFDVGPANVLLDAWCELHTRAPFDHEGRWALEGQVLAPLLHTLLDHPYFKLPPPKSTGRDLFHLNWLQTQLKQCYGQAPPHEQPRAVDVQATLMELTARTCIDALKGLSKAHEPPTELMVCGGGAKNQALLCRLGELCLEDPTLKHTSVRSVAQVGLGVHLVEALAFAWLAFKRVKLESANVPSVTGALGPRVLGSWLRA
jgi:anhydro-N-acetylmuramic acid kinase